LLKASDRRTARKPLVCSRASEDCQLYKKSPQAFSSSYRRDPQVHL
jgi:hypothetical protein